MVAAMGIETRYEDGNDVRKVNQLTNYAIASIKKTGYPFFIELETYRWREHCGPNFDNDIGYRSEDEYLEWKKRDPIKLFEKALIKEKIANKVKLNTIKKNTRLRVQEAFIYAEKSPFPDANKAFESMFKVS